MGEAQERACKSRMNILIILFKIALALIMLTQSIINKMKHFYERDCAQFVDCATESVQFIYEFEWLINVEAV